MLGYLYLPDVRHRPNPDVTGYSLPVHARDRPIKGFRKACPRQALGHQVPQSCYLSTPGTGTENCYILSLVMPVHARHWATRCRPGRVQQDVPKFRNARPRQAQGRPFAASIQYTVPVHGRHRFILHGLPGFTVYCTGITTDGYRQLSQTGYLSVHSRHHRPITTRCCMQSRLL